MHIIQKHPYDQFFNSPISDEIINLEYKKSNKRILEFDIEF